MNSNAELTRMVDAAKTTEQPIYLVEHTDIGIHLPTFHSNGIEAKIHTIKPLSSFFININDDMAFLKAVYPEDFVKVDENGARMQIKDIPETWLKELPHSVHQ